jgi:DNA-binding transcriptional regulator YdaS (Cro superfamily)
MDKLLAFIKPLSPEDRRAFFTRCGTTEGYARKAASQGKFLGPAICVSIERESGLKVLRQDLRDDWASIWPELIREAA